MQPAQVPVRVPASGRCGEAGPDRQRRSVAGHSHVAEVLTVHVFERLAVFKCRIAVQQFYAIYATTSVFLLLNSFGISMFQLQNQYQSRNIYFYPFQGVT